MRVDLSEYQRDDGPAINAIQRALILKTFPGFAGLDAAGLAALASITREVFFPANAVIHEPGVPVVAFHLVVEGEVQMYRNGRESALMGPRSSIGGLAALTRDPEGAHSVALSDVLALEVDTDDMQDLFEDNYSVLLGVLTAMSGSLRDAQMAMGGGAAIAGSTAPDPVVKSVELTLVEKMFFLRRTSNFKSVSIEALADLAEGSYEKRYASGEIIWELGVPADYSVQLLSGRLECIPEQGESWEFGVGMIVGGLDSLARRERWYACRAKGDVRLMVLQRTVLFDTLEDHIDMAMDLLRNLATGLNAILTRLASQADASE